MVESKEDIAKNEEETEIVEVNKEDKEDFYDWVMIPITYTDEHKNGVTFKGESGEFIDAHQRVFKMLNIKGIRYKVNEREIRILDNPKSKPIKVEVTPLKGPSGTVNVNIYNKNGKGFATIMITKLRNSEMIHVKVLAFKVIKYLIDGILDGEISESDIEKMKQEPGKYDDNSDLVCQICAKVFKTRQGLKMHITRLHIHEENVRKNSLVINSREDNDKSCKNCKFSFMNKSVKKIHEEKCGQTKVAEDCDRREKNLKSFPNVNEHKTTAHERQKIRCDYCDFEIEVTGNGDVHSLSKHKEECLCKPIVISTEKQIRYGCDQCEHIAKNNENLKRHKRDEHDSTTKSTSPKPKKRRKASKTEDMEIDSEIIRENVELMEEDDSYQRELIERSKLQDEKVLRKEASEKKKDDEYKKLKEVLASEKRQKEHKLSEAKRLEKRRLKSKRKNSNKKEKVKKTQTATPYLKDIPSAVKKLIGEDMMLFPVQGDGACGPRTFAAWIFQDPSLGPYLARNINAHFVKYWEYWKKVFVFPFVRNVGNGKNIEIHNKEELFNFLLSSNEGAFMWRGQEDFCVVANTYQVRIKIITIRGYDDENPVVNIIEPNPEFAQFSELPAGTIPDMIVLHEYDSHYNLIVPSDSMLAREGGLDHQRIENLNKNAEVENSNKNLEKEPIKAPESLEDRVKKLEAKLEEVQNRCDKLEKKNKELINEIRDSKIICEDGKSKEEEKVLLNLKRSGFRRQNPQFQPEENLQCKNCDCKFLSQEQLNIHMKTHSVSEYKCQNCDYKAISKVILDKHKKTHMVSNNSSVQNVGGNPSKENLEVHIRTKHKKQSQFTCEDCSFQGETSIQLKKHIILSGHSPSDYEETCFTCGDTFKSYSDLINHLKSEHPSNKVCRYFKENACIFEDSECRYRHIIQSETEDQSHVCNKCGKTCKTRSDLKRHLKGEHREIVANCKKFSIGKCERIDEFCWFLHEKKDEELINKVVEQSSEEMETGSFLQKSVFHEAKEKSPPDALTQIMEILTKLSLKMESLDQRTL